MGITKRISTTTEVTIWKQHQNELLLPTTSTENLNKFLTLYVFSYENHNLCYVGFILYVFHGRLAVTSYARCHAATTNR